MVRLVAAALTNNLNDPLSQPIKLTVSRAAVIAGAGEIVGQRDWRWVPGKLQPAGCNGGSTCRNAWLNFTFRRRPRFTGPEIPVPNKKLWAEWTIGWLWGGST